jgi:hypothetical protein
MGMVQDALEEVKKDLPLCEQEIWRVQGVLEKNGPLLPADTRLRYEEQLAELKQARERLLILRSRGETADGMIYRRAGQPKPIMEPARLTPVQLARINWADLLRVMDPALKRKGI